MAIIVSQVSFFEYEFHLVVRKYFNWLKLFEEKWKFDIECEKEAKREFIIDKLLYLRTL